MVVNNMMDCQQSAGTVISLGGMLYELPLFSYRKNSMLFPCYTYKISCMHYPFQLINVFNLMVQEEKLISHPGITLIVIHGLVLNYLDSMS